LGSDPIYLELDETNPGCEHYDLLLVEETDIRIGAIGSTPSEKEPRMNQSAMNPEQYDFCKKLLQDKPDTSWYKLGQLLSQKYNLLLTKASLRRLHARFMKDVKKGPQRLSADELQANYYNYASELIKVDPSLSWYQLRSQLEKDRHVTASDGVFKRFYNILPSKSTAIMTLPALREHFTDIACAMIDRESAMTASLLKAKLQKQHNVTAHDSTMQTFFRELKHRSAPCQSTPVLSLDDLRTNFKLIVCKMIEQQPTITCSLLKAELHKHHNITANDVTMRRFYRDFSSVRKKKASHTA
jgi:hypothetical protein